jgi:hypothetical protein
VTLVVTVNGPKSIWLLADRRLSFKDRQPKDDACKIMFLETTDGVAIFGYAGLGATGLGTEPGDWMSAVLRGRDLPLDQSIVAVAEAMKKEFPRHMTRMPGGVVPAHHVMVPAFLGKEPRLYEIDLVFAPDRKGYAFRCTRLVASYTGTTRDASGSPPIPIIMGGIAFQALATVLMPRFLKRVEKMRAGQPAPEWDEDELNAELAHLPDKPDENLR